MDMNKFFTKALEVVERLDGFATTEIPLYIQEILVSQTITAWVTIIGLGVVVGLCCMGFRWLGKLYRNRDIDKEGFVAVRILVGSVGITCFLCILPQIVHIVQIKYTPRVIIVDYLNDKIK